MEARRTTRAEAYLAAPKSDLAGKKSERGAKIQKAQVDINLSEAALRKATGDVSKAQSDVATSEQQLNKAGKEVLDMQVQVARQQSQVLMTPFDGLRRAAILMMDESYPPPANHSTG